MTIALLLAATISACGLYFDSDGQRNGKPDAGQHVPDAILDHDGGHPADAGPGGCDDADVADGGWFPPDADVIDGGSPPDAELPDSNW